MFGKLLSTVVKVVTLPIDIVEIGASLALGEEEDRKELKDTFPMPSTLRDKVCEVLEDI